jgi:hypothetical protein
MRHSMPSHRPRGEHEVRPYEGRSIGEVVLFSTPLPRRSRLTWQALQGYVKYGHLETFRV